MADYEFTATESISATISDDFIGEQTYKMAVTESISATNSDSFETAMTKQFSTVSSVSAIYFDDFIGTQKYKMSIKTSFSASLSTTPTEKKDIRIENTDETTPLNFENN